MKTIHTQRLTLRGLRPEDLNDFYSYCKHKDVGPRAGWPPHTDLESSEKILMNMIAEQEVWGIEEKATGRLIGTIGLHKDTERKLKTIRMLGYVIASSHWGLGFTTEAAHGILDYAFNKMQLELVCVNHYPFNIGSKRVIEKCGFTYEGTLRKACEIYDGTVYDKVCYSLTADEWRSFKATL